MVRDSIPLSLYHTGELSRTLANILQVSEYICPNVTFKICGARIVYGLLECRRFLDGR
ncbi:hypothetical protein C8R41DRAFT_849067 [Lentinula lateritia]|uniref:Uncharacterized protein n=1 Tax=Lentinula lateritia TaxID=40482 RepID=A0ABQ8VA17_9AGAR|nr:hypothetical protein C8R41DRAFT_849067 [Lentinula lateritia]